VSGVGVKETRRARSPGRILPIAIKWHGASFTLDVATCRRSIVYYLLDEGKQLQDVATEAGVSRMSLWRFMQGRQCSPATVRRILTAVHVDLKRVLRTSA
jgi:helix-turn-helix protein